MNGFEAPPTLSVAVWPPTVALMALSWRGWALVCDGQWSDEMPSCDYESSYISLRLPYSSVGQHKDTILGIKIRLLLYLLLYFLHV